MNKIKMNWKQKGNQVTITVLEYENEVRFTHNRIENYESGKVIHEVKMFDKYCEQEILKIDAKDLFSLDVKRNGLNVTFKYENDLKVFKTRIKNAKLYLEKEGDIY
jgi:hypothetical protein